MEIASLRYRYATRWTGSFKYHPLPAGRRFDLLQDHYCEWLTVAEAS